MKKNLMVALISLHETIQSLEYLTYLDILPSHKDRLIEEIIDLEVSKLHIEELLKECL